MAGVVPIDPPPASPASFDEQRMELVHASLMLVADLSRVVPGDERAVWASVLVARADGLGRRCRRLAGGCEPPAGWPRYGSIR